jgi:LmbE family N-acetylglucosaminyl deacetylase
MSKSILVVAAHPDDEALGCGGIMARHADAGDSVHVLFLTDGVGARGSSDAAAARRNEAAARACALLGSEAPVFNDLPDNRMDSVPLLDIVQIVEAAVRRVGPAIVYTHHAGDLNVDHRIAHEAVLTACRPQPGHGVMAIYAFEVPSSTDYAGAADGRLFRPQRFVDIAAQWDRKRAALEAYADEMRPYPHSRSLGGVEALARWRGVSAGFAIAEALEVVRERIASP